MTLRFIAATAMAVSLAGCGINSIPTAEETVNARWADVQNDYQRRADLIPNLVATVKAAGAQEKSILVEVTRARAGANAVTLSPEELSDPAKVRQYERAQNAISLSLQRMQEAYPELKSQGNYTTLMSQLEGTENRIVIARRDYNAAVQAYNTKIRTFPDAVGAKIFYGAKPKVPFQATSANADVAPTVNFGNGA
ncbi:MAG: LemA family protein [Alphaproteobacteria bacterium]|jgi:LemA protein|nr:MAG: LemA family protein [Alphaproteobacteria bacterium]